MIRYYCYSSVDDQERDDDYAEEMEDCVDMDGNHSRDIVLYKQICIVKLNFYSYYEDSDIFCS